LSKLSDRLKKKPEDIENLKQSNENLNCSYVPFLDTYPSLSNRITEDE
jgi:hypothetical protein